MSISINLEDDTWKLIIYIPSIVAFLLAMLPLYIFSTMSIEEKNSAFFTGLIYFALFMVLIFLIVEVIDLNRKLERLNKKIKELSKPTQAIGYS